MITKMSDEEFKDKMKESKRVMTKQKFMKNDVLDNKPIMHLIDAKFKEELAMLLTLGGFKYDFENWRKANRSEVIKY